MKELGITKGEWYWDGDPTNYDHKNEAPWLIAGGVTIITDELEAKNKADVDLIVDAGNTAQKCGLLPSELLQQRDELKEALAEMIWQFGYRSTYEGRESLHTGGLSALESAFGALGLSDPIALLDFEAAIKNTETK